MGTTSRSPDKLTQWIEGNQIERGDVLRVWYNGGIIEAPLAGVERYGTPDALALEIGGCHLDRAFVDRVRLVARGVDA